MGILDWQTESWYEFADCTGVAYSILYRHMRKCFIKLPMHKASLGWIELSPENVLCRNKQSPPTLVMAIANYLEYQAYREFDWEVVNRWAFESCRYDASVTLIGRYVYNNLRYTVRTSYIRVRSLLLSGENLVSSYFSYDRATRKLLRPAAFELYRSSYGRQRMDDSLRPFFTNYAISLNLQCM